MVDWTRKTPLFWSTVSFTFIRNAILSSSGTVNGSVLIGTAQ